MTAPGLRQNDLGRHDARLDELDSLLADAAAAASTAASPADFSSTLLRLAVQAARGAGGAVWVKDAAGRWRAEITAGTAPPDADRRAETAGRVAEAGLPRLTAAPEATGGTGPASVFAPMGGWVLELLVPADAAEIDGRLLVEIARSFAEIGGEYVRGCELDRLRMLFEQSRRLEQFTRTVYRPLELGPTAYAIVNDGRTAVGCDRLTVTAAPAGRVLAVSGVEFADRRSDAVRHLERFATVAIAAGGRYWRFRGERVESDSDLSSPEVERAWHEYAAFLQNVSVDLVVLTDRSDESAGPAPVGALIAEWFGDVPEATPDRVLPVAVHAEQALRNSLATTPGPIEAGLRKLAAPFRRRHRSKSSIIAIALVALCAALAFIPVDFEVTARGRLMPVRARDVFAPSDGVVQSLEVRHGDKVARDETLLSLVDPLLDLEHERIIGELGTSRQRLLAVQAERATTGRAAEASLPAGQLAADERELTAKIESLERQLEILQRQRGQLAVRSPLDGVVLTWEADERLEGRPVRRGQRLLTVVDLDQDWRLELFVPDRSVGHLLAARGDSDRGLPIDYLLATEPQTTYHTTLDRVALSTEPNDDGEPSLRATARLSRDDVPVPRPGATVVANIHCGRRPIGYVWFHELYEAFLTHVLF